VLDGRPPASEAERRVVLVTHRHGTVGFLVSRVNNIEVTRWERTAGGSGAAGRAQGPQARALDAMVEVGDGDHKRTLRRVDLRAIADGLVGRPDGDDRGSDGSGSDSDSGLSDGDRGDPGRADRRDGDNRAPARSSAAASGVPLAPTAIV